MASTTNTARPYIFQRPSTTATRSLVSKSDSKAYETSPTSTDGTSSTTSHYERAAADAAKNGNVGGASAVSGTDRPGTFGRQQSWDMRDLKRAHHEALIAGQSATGRQGYNSTEGSQQ